MTLSAEEIIGAAGRDPRELAGLLTAAQPERTIALARAFEEAGQTAQESYARARRSHGEIAHGYTSDGVPVLDAGAAGNQAWRLLGRGGQDMEDTATFLKRAVAALDAAQGTSTAALTQMGAELDRLLRSWSAYLQANLGQFDPADRERAIAAGATVVGTAGSTIQRAIDTYDGGLVRDAADLVGRGYTDATVTGDGGALESAVRDQLQRVRENGGDWFSLLGGGGAGAAVVALGLKDSWKVVSKGAALLRFLDRSSKPITDYDTFLRNIGAADDALQEFAKGKPNGGVLRFAMGSRAAGVVGKAFLPLTVVSGAMDAVTGGGYDGSRGWATRGFGAAGAIGAGTLLASGAGLVALGPVGLGIAGAAVLGYGAWSAGNVIWDHREQIADATGKAVEWTGDRLGDAADWAGARLSDAGEVAEDVGKKAVSTLSFGLL